MVTLCIPKHPHKHFFLLKTQRYSHHIAVNCLQCKEKEHQICQGLDISNFRDVKYLLSDKCEFECWIGNSSDFSKRYHGQWAFKWSDLCMKTQFKVGQVDCTKSEI